MVKDGDDLVTMFLDARRGRGTHARSARPRHRHQQGRVEVRRTGRRLRRHRRAQGRVDRRESARVLRRRGPLRITETHHGFINANAGIDLSNTDDGTAVLLPKDPDRSARRFRAEIQRRCDVEVAVIITDTFGRVWRVGVTDVAIGSAGVKPILDLRGTTDATGRVLEVTEVAIADEIAERGEPGARQGRSDTVRDPARSR